MVERESAISHEDWVCSCRTMVNCMLPMACGQPRYNAVAAMTNIAFPDADVVGEECPFGLQGRRRGQPGGSGALNHRNDLKIRAACPAV